MVRLLRHVAPADPGAGAAANRGGGMNLYLVRHGFSTGNRDQRIQGQWDTDLTTEGWRQAGTTGRFLAHYFAGMGWPVNAIYSSDLKRAWHTAETIGRYLGLAPVAVPGLRE